jgi:hypothetical protein
MNKFINFIVLCLGVWILVLVILWNAHSLLLNWDEVDYVNAAKQGVWANLTERGSLTPQEYIAFARSKLLGRPPNLPPNYEEARDPFNLRHFHPPFVVVLLSPLSDMRSERLLRSIQLLGALSFISVVLLSYRGLSPTPKATGYLTVSVLVVWAARLLFSSISMHGWEAVWVTAVAALLSRWLRDGQRGTWAALCASLALALFTLETGLIVCVIAALCILVWSPATVAARASWCWVVLGTASVILFVMIIWPGVILKASLIKSVLLYLYRMKSMEEYSSVSKQSLYLVWTLLPVWLPSIPAISWLVLADRSNVRRWAPYVVVGSVYSVALLRFAVSPSYVVAAIGPLICVIGLVADNLSSVRIRVLVTGVCLLVAWGTAPRLTEGNESARDDLRYLGAALRDREALMDGGHIYQYYLGPRFAIRPVTVSYDGESISVRENGTYRKLGKQDLGGKLVVLQKNRRVGPSLSSLLEGCQRTEKNTIRLYDCR